MADLTLHEMFASSTVTRAVSRLKTQLTRMQDFLGIGIGGPRAVDQGGDKFGYDLFERTRKIATGRPFGTGPATRAPQVVGHATISAYRTHEKMHMAEAKIFRNRPIGGAWGTIDNRGQSYVTRQEGYMAELFRNNREFMASRVFRGGFGVSISGDNWTPVNYGAGTFDIDFQIPAGNKTQLDMLGGGDIIATTWSNTAADIPAQLRNINAAFEQLHGRPLRHIWINSTTVSNVFNNAKIQAIGGSAAPPFQLYGNSGIVGPDGIEDTGQTAIFSAYPMARFHIYDGGLEVNGSFEKFIPDNIAVFLPEPDNQWIEFYNGSEIIAENVMAPGREAFGLSSWVTRTIDPAGFDLKSLDIGIPVLYNPNCVAYGTVVF